jgi:two-component system alkaline phosphatase synthesis response regulator PhoP
MILSECHDEQRIVEGLNVVADDYVTKPYSPRPLLARVQALLRRSSINRNGGYLEDDLSMGEITLNFHLMCVEANGHRVRLTQREFALLHCLMQNAGRVLTRDQIMRLAWGENFVGTAKCVDVNVQRLRNKIGPYLGNGFCIQALRGFGYKFETQGNSVRPIPTRPHVADSANPADDNYVFVTDGGGTKAGSGALSPA